MDKLEQGKDFFYAVTNLSQIEYDETIRLFSENHEKLESGAITVFGAGVRGSFVSLMLEKLGYSDFDFVDNRPEMVGGTIGRHPIRSVETLAERNERRVVIITPDQNRGIPEQLTSLGVEPDQWIQLGNLVYARFLKEFDREYGKQGTKTLLLGDCHMLNCTLSESPKISLERMLRDRYENSKTLCVNALTIRAMYQIVHAQIQKGLKPERVILSLDVRNFNGKEHFLANTQHVDLFHELARRTGSPELREHLSVVQNRYDAARRLNNSHGMKKFGNQPDSRMVNRAYVHFNYRFVPDEKNEELDYLKKICLELERENIALFPVIMPVNYEMGVELCGPALKESLDRASEFLVQTCRDCRTPVLNLCTLLEGAYFLDKSTFDEAPCRRGKRMIADRVIAQMEQQAALQDAEPHFRPPKISD